MSIQLPEQFDLEALQANANGVLEEWKVSKGIVMVVSIFDWAHEYFAPKDRRI